MRFNFPRPAQWVVMLALLAAAPLRAEIPVNNLPVKIGEAQDGGARFRGGLAIVRVYNRILTPAEIRNQSQTCREGGAPPPGFIAEWFAEDDKGPEIPDSAGLDLEEGFTLEAFIHPDAGMSGRILDKITPGATDGILLDTHPGNALRLMSGNDVLTCPLPHAGDWRHIVATVGATGAMAIFVDGMKAAENEVKPDALAYTGRAPAPADRTTLGYRRPAAKWTEASVIGNGRLGGLVYGGVRDELIHLNEDTLWSGEPYENLNPKGLAALPEIRRLLLEDKFDEAQNLLNRDMLGRYNQNYLPLGDLKISFPVTGAVEQYRRDLSLSEGVARVQFSQGGATFTREVFASYPAHAIVVRLSCDQPGRISFNATLATQLHGKLEAAGNALILRARAPAHSDPSYVGSGQIDFDDAPDGKGMRAETRLVPVAEGGRVTLTDQGVAAEGCNAVTLLLVAATSYNGPDKSPSREGRDPAALCDDMLAPLAGQPYDKLRAAHIADHGALFNRVKLELGPPAANSEPTDRRIHKYAAATDPGFAALYYQFGRYLLIAGSRPGSQPLNLQGIWNVEMRPPWSANWTLNCNAEINYWMVEAANLGECHLPLVELTRQLSVDGANMAKKLYGVRGWVAHHNTDIWRQAGPVSGTGLWSMFPAGGAWLCQHVWEHYAFSGDRDYLAQVWPVLAGAARYYLDAMVEEPSHKWLVTSPDTNFENSWRRPDGRSGWICTGPTASMQMIRQLFQNCVEGDRILGVDEGLRAEIEKALPRLPPMQISPTSGELQEWTADWARTAECQVLSMWGAVCGNQITPRGTPELAAGLRKIFDSAKWWKAGRVGSWQGSFQANTYARLGDGNTALEVVDAHIARCVNPNLFAAFSGYCPFQIDGNMGHAAAIGEMLLQSHVRTGPDGVHELELLPALPAAWPEGSVRGLRARGGFEVDLAWKGGVLTAAAVKNSHGGACLLRLRDKVVEIKLTPGQAVEVDANLEIRRF